MLGFAGIAAALTRPTELAGPLLAALLVFPTLGLAAAPVNSRAAQRAALPPDLRARRTTEWKRSQRRTFARGVAAGGGVVTVAGVVAAALALFLAPAKHPVQPPQLTGPGPSTTRQSPSQVAVTQRRARRRPAHRRAARPRRLPDPDPDQHVHAQPDADHHEPVAFADRRPPAPQRRVRPSRTEAGARPAAR